MFALLYYFLLSLFFFLFLFLFLSLSLSLSLSLYNNKEKYKKTQTASLQHPHTGNTKKMSQASSNSNNSNNSNADGNADGSLHKRAAPQAEGGETKKARLSPAVEPEPVKPEPPAEPAAEPAAEPDFATRPWLALTLPKNKSAVAGYESLIEDMKTIPPAEAEHLGTLMAITTAVEFGEAIAYQIVSLKLSCQRLALFRKDGAKRVKLGVFVVPAAVFKMIPAALRTTLSEEQSAKHTDLVEGPVDEFIEAALATSDKKEPLDFCQLFAFIHQIQPRSWGQLVSLIFPIIGGTCEDEAFSPVATVAYGGVENDAPELVATYYNSI